ncbi:MAG: spondin domain-containing protein [Chloroflexi bacterium]|nr:spondin domain-containing protein [Chloroflexota bacterium]
MSKRVMAITVGVFAVLLMALGSAGTASAQEATYTVTIENLTDGQPFTPPVLVVHSADMDLFELGEAASNEIAQLAENGNGDPLVALANAAGATVVAHDAPIMPGERATLSITAASGSYLSAAFMLICTNDGFSGLDSIVLSGSTTVETNAYDAGSETNTEDFADIVPPCQGLIGVESDDEGTGMSNPALAEGGVIRMHAGIEGGTDLTVADHGWTNPVARITVSAGDSMMDDADSMMDDAMMDDADSMESGMDSMDTSLPAAGTGPVDSGNGLMWFYLAAVAGAVLVVVGGALRLRRTAQLSG